MRRDRRVAPDQIEQVLKEGACATLPVEAPWLRLNYGFILKRGRTPSPAVSTFMAIARELEAGGSIATADVNLRPRNQRTEA